VANNQWLAKLGEIAEAAHQSAAAIGISRNSYQRTSKWLSAMAAASAASRWPMAAA